MLPSCLTGEIDASTELLGDRTPLSAPGNFNNALSLAADQIARRRES
jgi:hypothetical protein